MNRYCKLKTTIMSHHRFLCFSLFFYILYEQNWQENLISVELAKELREHFDDLFKGKFPTGGDSGVGDRTRDLRWFQSDDLLIFVSCIELAVARHMFGMWNQNVHWTFWLKTGSDPAFCEKDWAVAPIYPLAPCFSEPWRLRLEPLRRCPLKGRWKWIMERWSRWSRKMKTGRW